MWDLGPLRVLLLGPPSAGDLGESVYLHMDPGGNTFFIFGSKRSKACGRLPRAVRRHTWAPSWFRTSEAMGPRPHILEARGSEALHFEG